MTVYRACWGCVSDGSTCPTRAAVRDQIRGLGVTSIKWRCKDRVPKFKIGDAVWVRTVSDMASSIDDNGETIFGDYPGHVVDIRGSKILIHIPAGAFPRNEDDYPFSPSSHSGHGFCKVPFARVTARDSDREEICPQCSLPASQGHISGYACEYKCRLSDLSVMSEVG